MIFAIPFVGWIIGVLVAISMAIPFWLCWSVWGIGEKYFYFLPEVYRYIGFWNCVGLSIVISILKSTFYPSFSNNVSTNGKK
jgi:hypothetical protein